MSFTSPPPSGKSGTTAPDQASGNEERKATIFYLPSAFLFAKFRMSFRVYKITANIEKTLKVPNSGHLYYTTQANKLLNSILDFLMHLLPYFLSSIIWLFGYHQFWFFIATKLLKWVTQIPDPEKIENGKFTEIHIY